MGAFGMALVRLTSVELSDPSRTLKLRKEAMGVLMLCGTVRSRLCDEPDGVRTFQRQLADDLLQTAPPSRFRTLLAAELAPDAPRLLTALTLWSAVMHLLGPYVRNADYTHLNNFLLKLVEPIMSHQQVELRRAAFRK